MKFLHKTQLFFLGGGGAGGEAGGGQIVLNVLQAQKKY